MKPKTSYPDLLANLFQSARAWRTTTLVLSAVLLVMGMQMLWLANNRSVILMPQNLANATAPITLNLGEPFTPDYITAVAKGDAYSLLSWTPHNIEAQYNLFLGRLTPATFEAKREALLMELKSHKEEGVTQSFYISRTFVEPTNASVDVTLHGFLVRSMGGKEIFRGPAAYRLSYVNAGGGMVRISEVRQPTEKEYRATELAAAGKK